MRQDNGKPSWPFPVDFSSIEYTDGLKALKYGLDFALGPGAEVWQMLHHEGNGTHAIPGDLLRWLQSPNEELPLRRHVPPNGPVRCELLFGLC
jgi:hypothetical protein